MSQLRVEIAAVPLYGSCAEHRPGLVQVVLEDGERRVQSSCHSKSDIARRTQYQ